MVRHHYERKERKAELLPRVIQFLEEHFGGGSTRKHLLPIVCDRSYEVRRVLCVWMLSGAHQHLTRHTYSDHDQAGSLAF